MQRVVRQQLHKDKKNKQINLQFLFFLLLVIMKMEKINSINQLKHLGYSEPSKDGSI